MKLIDRVDIESWAEKYEGKGFFPFLISKLVYFSTLPGAQINIPSGSAVYLGGWDGIIYSEQQRPYIPAGRSLWEFGTNKDFKTKANADFDKRSKDPLGYDPSQCTYVFSTPRIWANKEKWRAEKAAMNIWKDIWVFDAVDLEQWLEQSGPAAVWFARELQKTPSHGALDAEQIWKEWSIGEVWQIKPKVVVSGREEASEQLSDFLKGEPNIITVQAKSKTEALAFIIGSVKDSFEEDQKNRFFSKTMIVDKEESFRTLSLNYVKSQLNLIPKFDDKSLLQAAVSNGHHVIIPVGADGETSSKTIVLPTINKEGQIEGLIEMGLTKENAEHYSREAGRDINKLRRLLKFIDNKAPWFKPENIREIIPALILGRWNIYNPGDCEILEKLSGLPIDDYLEILNRWKNYEDSPILQIGSTWRLTSPLDLWNSISKFINKNDLQILSESFQAVFKDRENNGGDQLIRIVHSLSKPKKYSEWAQEGLVQTLILLSLHGENITLADCQNPVLWVDNAVYNLLFDADADLWRKCNRKLPLIAEASPKSFIKAVENSLQKAEPEIMGMFKTKAGFLGETSSHTGLLWALEGLAWLPEYLFTSTVLLLKLAELDPGGSLANRPERSVSGIYRPWYYQTLAPFDKRMEILKAAVKKNKTEGWKLLKKLMPKSHDNGMTSSKMRWRLFDKNTKLQYSNEETYRTFPLIADLMLELFDGSDEKLADLIEHSSQMTSSEDCEKLLLFIEENSPKIPRNSTLSRDKIRKILHRHRSSPDAYWSLDESILDRYHSIYEALEPENTVLKHMWLFESSYISLPDGKLRNQQSNSPQRHNDILVMERRIEAMQILVDEIGIDRIIKLADTPQKIQTIAFTLAKISLSEDQTIILVSSLKKPNANKKIISLYISNRTVASGLSWLLELSVKLRALHFEDSELIILYSDVEPSIELWNYIDSVSETFSSLYWRSVSPFFLRLSIEENITAINKLLQYNRFKSSVRAAYYVKKELSTELLCNILIRTATEESSDDFFLEANEITSLLKQIEKREDADKNTLLKLEWLYLTVLTGYLSGYKPKLLHKELAKNPDFFIDVLKWTYISEEDRKIEIDSGRFSKEALLSMKLQGYKLLDDFKKIPGMLPDNTIEHSKLQQWVNQVRKLAGQEDRLEQADKHIGMLLAHFPGENNENWPTDEISEIIENINTVSLKENFSVTLVNKRAFTSRSPFEGGRIEKENAAHFQKLANLHQYNHPNLSEIFKEIAQNYLFTALHQDNQAERDRLDY